MSDPKFFKCACPHCAGHIEFGENMAGQMIDCPHCRQKIKLSAPGGEPELPPAPPREKKFKSGPDCGAKMDEKAIVCVQCGAGAETGTAETPEKSGKNLLILAVLIILAAAGGGFFLYQKKQPAASPRAPSRPLTGTPSKSSDKIEPPPKPPKSLADLKVETVTLDQATDGNLVYATGTLRNDSDYQRFGVKIEIELLDAAGRKVSAATDYIPVMEPRDDWHFRALVNDSKTVKARIASIKED